VHRRTIIALASIALSLVLTVACGKPLSPAEKISQQRSKYTATLNGFVVHSVPEDGAQGGAMMDETDGAMDQAMDQAGDTMADEGGTEEMAAGEDAEAMPVPTRQDAILDILVTTTSKETLPRLTVDIDQVDADKNPKGHWLATLDTSEVLRGPGSQISYTVENVDYTEGDGFTVDVRHPVPPEDRGQYPEFQESNSAE